MRLVSGQETYWATAGKSSSLSSETLVTEVIECSYFSSATIKYLATADSSSLQVPKLQNVLSFSSSLSEGGGLLVYTKPWCILCHLVIRTRHSGAKERGTCGERSIQGPLAQTSHPAAEGISCPWSWAGLFKKIIFIYTNI